MGQRAELEMEIARVSRQICLRWWQEGGLDSKGESPNLDWIKIKNKLYDEYMIKILVKLPKSYEPAFFLKSSMLKEALCNVSYALTLSLKWRQ